MWFTNVTHVCQFITFYALLHPRGIFMLLGAVRCCNSVFWPFGFRSVCFLLFFFFSPHVDFFSSSISRDSFSFSYMYSCIAAIIASTDMSFFRIFLFSLLSPVDFPKSDRNFEAKNSPALIVSKSQFSSTSKILLQLSAAVPFISHLRSKKVVLHILFRCEMYPE